MESTVAEIAPNVYRIHTAVTDIPGGFSFNQFLIADDEPLLFHTGHRRLFASVSKAIATVLPLAKLRYLAFSHFESDECGALNEFLATAPNAVPVCSRIGAMISVSDFADRAPRPLADGERLSIGSRELSWIDAPQVPHGWEAGYLYDAANKILFAGDLFTLPGTGDEAIVESDLVGPAEAFWVGFSKGTGLPDYWSRSADGLPVFERLAALGATTLANMHGSCWRGAPETSASMIRELSRRVNATH